MSCLLIWKECFYETAQILSHWLPFSYNYAKIYISFITKQKSHLNALHNLDLMMDEKQPKLGDFSIFTK